tara:strand:+ start:79 stop:498 length:420 start_codon:yes stop_codon:yes gene_type:complete
MQLDLFKDLKPIGPVEGLECNDCGLIKPVLDFEHIPSGEIKRKCKSCKSHAYYVIKGLKKLHAYPDEGYCCPICERNIEEIGRKGQKMLQSWVLDHCHSTETFRGYVCMHCNTGLGAFKDDSTKVKKAYKYLITHEQKT